MTQWKYREGWASIILTVLILLAVAVLVMVPWAFAQDALLLTPEGPRPMLHIPEAGAGAIPGGGLWVPMTSAPHYEPTRQEDRWRQQMHEQLRETDRWREQFIREQSVPPAFREGSPYGYAR